jgi:hypothetical protein
MYQIITRCADEVIDGEELVSVAQVLSPVTTDIVVKEKSFDEDGRVLLLISLDPGQPVLTKPRDGERAADSPFADGTGQ